MQNKARFCHVCGLKVCPDCGMCRSGGCPINNCDCKDDRKEDSRVRGEYKTTGERIK